MHPVEFYELGFARLQYALQPFQNTGGSAWLEFLLLIHTAQKVLSGFGLCFGDAELQQLIFKIA